MSEANDDELRGHSLRVQRQVTGQAVVVHVTGELDLLTAPSLVGELTTARAQAIPPGPLVIDLTGVTFMASVGLSILIEHNRLCREGALELRVVAGNRTVARTITMTGLDDTLAVFPDLDAALATAR